MVQQVSLSLQYEQFDKAVPLLVIIVVTLIQ